MAEQQGRPLFRFRFPWVINTAPTAPRLPPQPQQAQPPTSVRPPGVASPRPSPQTQIPKKTDSQPSSPARTVSRPSSPAKNIPSQPPSPIQTTTQSRVVSQPPSPPTTAPSQTQARVNPELQPPSPSQIPTRQPRVTSQPSSPSRTIITQPETSTHTNSPHQSPSPRTPNSQSPPRTPPSHTTPKPQQATPQFPKTSSPTLTTSHTQRESQPPSPSQKDSQLDTETPLQPPTPSHMVSQLEEATKKTSQPHWPSHAPQSKSTTQAPTQTLPLPRSSDSPTEQPPARITPTQSDISEAPTIHAQKADTAPKETYQPDLKSKPSSGTLAVPIGPSQHPAPETNPDEKSNAKPGEEKEEKSTIPIEEGKQSTISALLHRALGSSINLKDQLNTSDEENQRKKHAHIQGKDVLAKDPTGKERKPAPSGQEDAHANTEYHSAGRQGEHSIRHHDIRDGISRFAHKMSVEHPEKTIDENQVSVITLAGENTGATMHLGSELARKESSVQIHRGYKLNQDISEASTDGENIARKRFKDQKPTDDTPAMYINSNTQNVNNSVVSNSSLNEGSPGVHIAFTRYPNEPMKPSRNTESVQTRKADFNTTRSKKLTYEPTVKRRCLRGLLMESSDSDPDNPDKPRRHGCRYDCNDK